MKVSFDIQFVKSSSANFRNILLAWSDRNPRNLPWKTDPDPYKIWVSEIILQQTRVQQGTPYYNRFITTFPTIQDLAKAEEDKLMQVWKGLGYYSRARNMQQTAKKITAEYHGEFPSDKQQLLGLKGIGSYTAAAILSFAFHKPHAVVDGNVVRVLSRLFGLQIDFNSASGKKSFEKIALELLDKTQPARYNQAIMDFGALQCVPKNPMCKTCVLNSFCNAYLGGKVGLFPVRKKPQPKKERFFIYLILQDKKGRIAIQKRNENDIWKSLYELPAIELDGFDDLKTDAAIKSHVYFKKRAEREEFIVLHEASQILSHQKINAKFYQINSNQTIPDPQNQLNFVYSKNLCNFAFPKMIESFLVSFKEMLDQKSTEPK